MRPLQYEVYSHIASCYSNKHAAAEDVDQCANNHFTVMKRVHAIVQHEMSTIQDRVNRCAMDCQDAVRDKYASSQDEAGANKMMYSCMSTCVDKHIALLKSVQANMEQQIDQITKGYK